MMGPTFGLLHFGRRELDDLQVDVGNIVRLARRADALGFRRFWLTQHFGSEELWGDPIPLLTLLAASTRHMSVGTGGILLRSCVIANLASTFKFLAAMFPDRIELGVVAARAAEDRSMAALSRDLVDDETFEERVSRLLSLMPPTAPIPPQSNAAPTIWLLGAGSRTGLLAASLGISYAHAASFHDSYRLAPADPPVANYALSYFVDMSTPHRGARAQAVGDQRLLSGPPAEVLVEIGSDVDRLGATDVLLAPMHGDASEREEWITEFARVAALAPATGDVTAAASPARSA